jgi:hypothetical protein
MMGLFAVTGYWLLVAGHWLLVLVDKILGTFLKLWY